MSGIWGGLWSLPEFPIEGEAAIICKRDWGLRCEEAAPLPRFEHAFTHFTLEVAPWKVRLAGRGDAVFGKPATWLALADVGAAALPSPVKKLLLAL